MAENTLGAVQIDIRGDWSKLSSDFAAAEAAAQRSASAISAGINSSLGQASGLVDQFGRSVQAAATATGAAAPSTDKLAASVKNLSGAMASTATTTRILTDSMQNATQAGALAATAMTVAAAAVAQVGQQMATALATIAANTNAASAAASNSTGGYIRLFSAIMLVRRGLDELDKFRQTEETLKNVSAATGLAADRLAAFEGAVSRAGGDGEQFGQVLGRLARAQETAAEGNTKMVDDLRRLGITAKDPIEAFYQLADTVHNTADPFEALGAAERVTGRNSIELVGILSQGADALRANAAASGEYAAALAKAIPEADRLTQTEVQLKQAIATVAAESFPSIIAILKAVAITVATVTDAFKIFFSVVIDGSFTAVAAIETLGKVSADALSGNLVKATADAVEGFDNVRTAAKHMVDDVRADFEGTNEFINKILNPPTATTKPGAGLPFPKPAPTPGAANKPGEIEDQSEANHAKALEAQAREKADALLAIQLGSDRAIIQSMEDRHSREILLAGAELTDAENRQKIFNDLAEKEVAAATAALQKKAALQARDGKNAAAEVARTQGEIQAVRDRADEEELRQADNVAKARAHFQDVEAAQGREVDTSTAKSGAKLAAVQQEGALEAKLLETERQVGVAAGATGAVRIQQMQAIAAAQAQQRDGAIAVLEAELQVEGDETKILALVEQITAKRLESANKTYAAETKVLEVYQQQIKQLSEIETKRQGEVQKSGFETQKIQVTAEYQKTPFHDVQQEIQYHQQLLNIQKQEDAAAVQELTAKGDILALYGDLIAAAKAYADADALAAANTNKELEAQNKLNQEKRAASFGQNLTTGVQSVTNQIIPDIGGALAQGITGPKEKGESTGQAIEKALKNVGIHLLGDLIKQVVTTIIAQTVAHIAQDWIRTIFLASIPKPFGFAEGGRPPVGIASIVGEKGPELFVPDSAGQIIPAGKFSQGSDGSLMTPGLPPISGVSNSASMSVGAMNFHVHGQVNPKDFVRQVAKELPNLLKAQGGPLFSPLSRSYQGATGAGL